MVHSKIETICVLIGTSSTSGSLDFTVLLEPFPTAFAILMTTLFIQV